MEFVFGKYTSKSVIKAKKRRFKKLYLSKQQKTSTWQAILPKGVMVESVEREKLFQLCHNHHHQGVVLQTSGYPYASVDEILTKAGHTLAVLDQVTDPMNLGAILRTAAALGVEGIILPRHQSADVTPLVQKVAVGAAEVMKVARVSNLVNFIKQAQTLGFWAVAAISKGGEPLNEFKFPAKAILVLGSEEKGIRPLIERQCDFSVSLPLTEPVESLNVSVAFALFAYQRKIQTI